MHSKGRCCMVIIRSHLLVPHLAERDLKSNSGNKIKSVKKQFELSIHHDISVCAPRLRGMAPWFDPSMVINLTTDFFISLLVRKRLG